MNFITVCFSPALYSYYNDENSVVVIVDVFRATTSMCVAFSNGVKSIRTVADIEEARTMKERGYLVAAERNVRKVDFADFGNSPFDFTSEKVSGKELVFTTTNGTKAVEKAKNADEIIIGAFSNIDAVKEFCISVRKNVFILCSGWNNRFCVEDTLFAGALAKKLIDTELFKSKSDAVNVSVDLWNIAKENLLSYICKTEHYERLVQNGLENSAEYCLTENTTPMVPRYNKCSQSFEL